MPPWFIIADVLIAAAIFLWSDVIGPEEIPPPEPRGNGSSSSRPSGGNSGKLALKNLRTSDVALIDRELFLSSFQRQSQVALLSCLRLWRPSPAELAMSGTLTKKTGRITHLRASDQSVELPSCAVAAVDNMTFDNVTPAMNRDTIDLQWRIDW